MRKSILVMFTVFISCSSVTLAAENSSESAVKEGLSSIVSSVVSTGKNAITGVVEGVTAGRKEGESADSAKVVTNKADFQKQLTASVIKTESLEKQKIQVTLAVRNDNDFPVRMASLNESKYVVLIDADGFSYSLSDPLIQGGDITAQPKSLTRVRFVFQDVEGTPSTLRLYEIDIPIPQSK